MKILSVNNLCKSYEKFNLDNIHFDLEIGYIMGFIGINGAGKTTTLKSILNMIYPDSGHVEILGKKFKDNEVEILQNIGFVVGDKSYYTKKRVKTITRVYKKFYDNWNDETYNYYIEKFSIDENKRIDQLSTGMRVKYSIILAISYDPKLIILDEPTSGLDPVARDSILELFQDLVKDGNRSILFSTHIITDLEKCADYITYIHNGRLIETNNKDDMLDSYRVVSGSLNELDKIKNRLISFKTNSFGFTALIQTQKLTTADRVTSKAASLDDIMIYHSLKEECSEKVTS